MLLSLRCSPMWFCSRAAQSRSSFKSSHPPLSSKTENKPQRIPSEEPSLPNHLELGGGGEIRKRRVNNQLLHLVEKLSNTLLSPFFLTVNRRGKAVAEPPPNYIGLSALTLIFNLNPVHMHLKRYNPAVCWVKPESTTIQPW